MSAGHWLEGVQNIDRVVCARVRVGASQNAGPGASPVNPADGFPGACDPSGRVVLGAFCREVSEPTGEWLLSGVATTICRVCVLDEESCRLLVKTSANSQAG